MEENRFDWIPFYKKFADKLLEYKDNRKELIKKLIKVFENTEMNFPKLNENGNPEDIDPFTVFGIFNRQITMNHRLEILREIIKEFNLDIKEPTNFDGIPLLNPQRINFSNYNKEPKEQRKEIENLYSLFETALKISKEETPELRDKFIKEFDQVVNQFGINWNITMGLFWIRPETFLNLDRRNRDLINNTDYFSELDKAFFKSGLNGKDYLNLRDKFFEYFNSNDSGIKSFSEFSDSAWENRNQVNRDIKASIVKWFKPIINALRNLGGQGRPPEVRAKIIENEKIDEKTLKEVRGKRKVNKFENEVAFARAFLVKAGLIDNSIKGVWQLTEDGWNVEMTDSLIAEIYRIGNKRDPVKSDQNSLGDAEVDTIHYWTYSPGNHSTEWENFYEEGIIALGWSDLGDLSEYKTKDEIRKQLQNIRDTEQTYKNASLALYQFANDLKPGDIVFAKKGQNEILGKGIIQSDYLYNEENGDYPNIRKVDWIKKGPWISNDKVAVKTLTDITNYPKLVDSLNNLIGNETEDEETEDSIVQNYPEYSKEKFLKEVYLDEDRYNKLVYLLKSKKNLILQGAPGVGKTYLAKRLAYSIMGEKDISRVEMIQFHQSYSYEDFIMGFRPTATHYDLVPGSFYNFCKKAEEDTENDYFFIIDEINRGNLSKIFGELFMLLENDKRGSKNKLQLLYSNEYFNIPENVYIIGMMNTADRSLALLDFALRRRFGFFDLTPGFDSQGFKNYMDELDSEKFNKLIREIKLLNNDISQDETLGKEFCIGHSFFCNLNSEDLDNYRLESIVEFEIIPLLNEYWFDEPEKVEEWSQNLKKAIQ